MYNQEDEIEQFFREQEGYSDKKEPDDGLPSILKSLDEQPNGGLPPIVNVPDDRSDAGMPSIMKPLNNRPNGGMPSIMRSLDERPDDEMPSILKPLNNRPNDDFQPSAFSSDTFSIDELEEDVLPKSSAVDPKGFNDSRSARYDRLREMEEQLEHDERISRCSIFAKKYMQMFLILIGGVAANVLLLIIANIASKNEDLITGAATIMIVISAVYSVFAILYGVILMGLGKYHLEFKSAGIYYILSGVCEAVRYSTSGWASFFFSLLAAVFSVLYILKFAVAMSNSFDKVAMYMAVTWETFKKAFIYVYAGIVGCTLLGFFPILNILAAIVLIVLLIAAVILSIWQIILVFRSANVMKQYATVIHA